MSRKDMYGKLVAFVLVAGAAIWFLWSLGHQKPQHAALPQATLKAARPQQEGGVVGAWTADGYLQTAADAAAVSLYKDGGNSETVIVTLDQAKADSPLPLVGISTPSDQSLGHTVRMAHRLNMRAALSLQVELTNDPTHWRSDIGRQMTATGRARWLAGYQIQVMHYARLAAAVHADELVLGSELGSLSGQTLFWQGLTAQVRHVFHGQLTYSAQLTEAPHVHWWGSLDQTGVDLYPILAETPSPSAAALAKAWKPIVAVLQQLVEQSRKPLLVTEIGYPSAVGAAEAPLSYGGDAKPDPTAQKRLYTAMFQALWHEPWLAGIWLYRWQEPDRSTTAGYTPRGKPAEQVVRHYFHAVS